MSAKSASGWKIMQVRRTASLVLLLVPTLVLSAFVTTPTAHAFLCIPGIVCIADPSMTTCPSSFATLTGSFGGKLTVAVNTGQVSDGFNAYDIRVVTDPGVLNPTGVNLT